MQNMRNHIQLIGNLSQGVDYKKLDNGNVVARACLSTREVYQYNSGRKVIDVQRHQLVGWGKVADMMQVLLNEGKQVAVQGRLIHRTFDDSEGQRRYRSEIVVNEFVIM